MKAFSQRLYRPQYHVRITDSFVLKGNGFSRAAEWEMELLASAREGGISIKPHSFAV
jgi:hypothetical protein